MTYAFDQQLKKWVVLLNDVVFRIFDSEEEAAQFISK